mmetsp:Transcript_19998/g.29951  ORF Transcript_19998/g.29951 Transcript_19998/m.29951 type:complete len:316 (+) Transcript_19998:1142-2089(+)
MAFRLSSRAIRGLRKPSAFRSVRLSRQFHRKLCTTTLNSAAKAEEEKESEIKVETLDNESKTEEFEAENGAEAKKDALDQAVALLKEAIVAGENMATKGMKTGEEQATKGIESARERMLESPPISMDMKMPGSVQSTLEATSHVVKEGKRAAEVAVNQAGVAVESVRSGAMSVGDRFSEALPNLPETVRNLPLTPELEMALETAVKNAERLRGETDDIAKTIAASLDIVSKEGASSTSRVAQTLADSTVDVVRQSFGKDAGAILEGGFNLARELSGLPTNSSSENKADVEANETEESSALKSEKAEQNFQSESEK